MKSLPLALLAALSLVACAADSYQRVPQPSIDAEVSPAMARVVVLRMPQTAGALRAVVVREGGREIGRIGRDEYLCWERPAGRTVAELDYEGPKIERNSQSVVELDGEAGRTSYYGITIDTAWNKPIVRPLDADEAREALHGSSPAPVR